MKLSEGRKMFLTVLTFFLINTAAFVIFDDIDRNKLNLLDEPAERRLLLFAIFLLFVMGLFLYRYAKLMDARIEREGKRRRVIERNEMRRQMTQNISHELKTPVSSILGYTETIIENPDIDQQTQRKFIERCHLQARRLTQLLNDLSTLNRLDNASEKIEKTTVNVSEIVSSVEEETLFSLQQHHISFNNLLPTEIKIKGNALLLHSIFRNLTENVINYAGDGTEITVRANRKNSYWHFVFSDNGVGVPDEKLPYLFERFFRIDEGRSRANGGTGLGLAIVKHSVMLHEGTISVKNQNGLRFDFSLKI